MSFRNYTTFGVDITRVKVARNTTRYVDQASGLASGLHDEHTGNKFSQKFVGIRKDSGHRRTEKSTVFKPRIRGLAICIVHNF